MKPLILVDCYNLAFRSHYACSTLTNKDGFPTGAIYGFLRAVLALKKISPRIVFCWDHGTPGVDKRVANWRMRLCPSYKADREKSQDAENAINQFTLIHGQLKNMGHLSYGIPGFEADDIIGMTCAQTDTQEILIFSTDEDLYQLLEGERVKVIRPKKEKKQYVILTAKQVEKEHGIPIRRWADYLTLGAAHNNVKAVRGWGPKKSVKLLEEGVDLLLPLDKQPLPIRKELAPHWERIRSAYMVTAIPRTPADSRISKLLPWEFNGSRTFDLSSYNPKTLVGEFTPALNTFMRFCTKYDLADFMEHRYEFFN